ncbi:10299_t:CDS:2, partial [Racocetra fulgida]
IEKELINRLKSKAYGDNPLNVNEDVWKSVLEGDQLEAEDDMTEESDVEDLEENESSDYSDILDTLEEASEEDNEEVEKPDVKGKRKSAEIKETRSKKKKLEYEHEQSLSKVPNW